MDEKTDIIIKIKSLLILIRNDLTNIEGSCTNNTLANAIDLAIDYIEEAQT